jgi:hypothetical protein
LDARLDKRARILMQRLAAKPTAGLPQACRARWEIEMLFNVLKNGCRVEALQLGMIERIERALAVPGGDMASLI